MPKNQKPADAAAAGDSLPAGNGEETAVVETAPVVETVATEGAETAAPPAAPTVAKEKPELKHADPAAEVQLSRRYAFAQNLLKKLSKAGIKELPAKYHVLLTDEQCAKLEEEFPAYQGQVREHFIAPKPAPAPEA